MNRPDYFAAVVDAFARLDVCANDRCTLDQHHNGPCAERVSASAIDSLRRLNDVASKLNIVDLPEPTDDEPDYVLVRRSDLADVAAIVGTDDWSDHALYLAAAALVDNARQVQP